MNENDNVDDVVIESAESSEGVDEAEEEASELAQDDVFNDDEFKAASDEEDEEEVKVKKDETEEEEEDDDEDKEVSEEEKAPAELIKEIAAKHKNIFKEYPQLKAAVYRDIQYSKVFPTPEAAIEAANDVEVYNQVQREVFNGRPDAIVKFFDDHKKPETLVRFGRNLIESAGKYNKDIWAGILFPSVTSILRDAETQARAAGNKNLEASVKHLTNFLFNQIDIPEDRLPKEEPQNNNGAEQVNNLISRQKVDFQDEVYSLGIKEVNKVIDVSLATLKCKPALKKAIAKELFDKVTKAVGKDSSIQGNLNTNGKRL